MKLRTIKRLWVHCLILSMGVPAMAKLPVQLKNIETEKTIDWRPANTKKTGIFFISSKCPCFRSAVDTIKTQSNKYHEEIEFIAITSEKKLKTFAKKYYKKLDLKMPIYFDHQMSTAKHFGILNTASVVILGLDGNILYSGGVAEENGADLLGRALEEIQSKGNTQVPFGKGMGCAIDE